jgi:hypothetical protein
VASAQCAVVPLPRLALLAEVAAPAPFGRGHYYLLGIWADVAQRLEELGSRIHADEVASVADASLCGSDADLWDLWTEFELWRVTVPGHISPTASMTERAEAVLAAVAVRLASALVAEALAAQEPDLSA